MTITASQVNPSSVNQMASGSHLDDAATPAAFSASLGFQPRYVCFINQTDRIRLEFFDGMTAAHAVKTIATGVVTAETSAGITVTSSGFSVAAANILQNKQYRWYATA